MRFKGLLMVELRCVVREFQTGGLDAAFPVIGMTITVLLVQFSATMLGKTKYEYSD
jgi:hypothetical protein